MKSFEYKQENKEIIEKIRTPIDARFSFVVTTKSFPDSLRQVETVSQPAEENYEVVIEDSQNREIVINLSDLIERPDNKQRVSFTTGEIFDTTGTNTKPLVRFPEKKLSDPKEIFGILHELGHISRDDNRDDNFSYLLLMARIKMKERKKPTVEEIQLVLREERDAWAETIRLARRLKKEYGVDLFKLFKSTDEFMGWLRATGLRSYETQLESLGIKAYTKDAKVKAWEEAVKNAVSSEDFDKEEER